MAQLDRNQIAAAGLAVLDRRGLAGFTIRAVAKALRVTPMALYHYVKNKAELAALVVNVAHNALPLDASTGEWREDLWAIARWARETTNSHSAVGELRRTYRIYSPEILLVAERWLSVWQQSGLPLKKTVLAARVSSMTIIGLVVEEAILRDLDKPEEALLARLPNARLMYESERDPESAYELAVRSLIDGLYARLKNETKSIVPRRRSRSASRSGKR